MARKKTDQPAQQSNIVEQHLARLEAITAEFNRSDIRIDQQLALYEEGMNLAKQCKAYLEAAELRIEQLQQSSEHQPND
jgi:exodeoxyribonuclease VII small subunit